MLQQIEVKRFKGVDYAKFDLGQKISIFEGGNALGKTTMLNAIVWLLNDKLYNDNEDVNTKRDSDVVKPINFIKGEKVSVSLTINDIVYTKLLREKKSGGNEAQYKINDYTKTREDFYKELYGALDYVPTLSHIKGLDEIALLTDVQYAFGKLDPNILRVLLVALGCEVSDEEIMSMIDNSFIKNELKKVTGKSLIDKLYALKTDLHRDKIQGAKSLDLQEHIVNQYRLAPVEEPSKIVFETLREKQDLIATNISKVKSGNVDVSSKEQEINVLVLTRNNNESEMRHQYDIQIEKLRVEQKALIEKRDSMSSNAQIEKNKKVEAIDEKVTSKQTILDAYLRTKKQFTDRRDELQRNRLKNARSSTLAVQEIERLKNTKYGESVIATCPCCGLEFDINEEDNKRLHQMSLNNIKEQEDIIAKISSEQVEIENALQQVKKDINDIDCKIIETDEAIEDLKIERSNVFNSPIELDVDIASQIELKSSEILNLTAKRNAVSDSVTQSKINLLKADIERIKLEYDNFIDTELEKLERDKKDVEASIDEWYSLSHKYEDSKVAFERLEAIQSELNDTEYNLNCVSDLIHSIVEKINHKANEITGLNFVMVVENKTNEGKTDVCYVIDEQGVPVKESNSANKLRIGMKFINRVKELLNEQFNAPMNQLPILIDGLEKIDSYSKIASLFDCQVIGTKVTDNTTLTLKEIL